MKPLIPAVGYVGGKRRLLPMLRPFFNPSTITTYVEPFVGMGAVYLDLRQRGYTGRAILADANGVVADFWRAVHCRAAGAALVQDSEELKAWPATEAGFWAMMGEPPGRDIVARFLWLTNFMYANLPPTYDGRHWVATRSSGTKLKSAAKWNKTFPWGPCVDRLRAIVGVLADKPCMILPDARTAFAQLMGHETVYADPPYVLKARYSGTKQRSDVDFAPMIFSSSADTIFTETAEHDPPNGWARQAASVLSRQAGPGNGAGAQRREFIYSNMLPCAPLAVSVTLAAEPTLFATTS